MMKEERHLRNIIKDLDTDNSCCPECGSDTERHRKSCRWGMIAPAITALIRAVRADEREKCAKKCDEMSAHYKLLRDKGKPEISKIDQDALRMFAAEDCAAAIREGK